MVLCGVLERDTIAHQWCIDLSRLAGMAPASVLVEIMNEDGTKARLPQLLEIASKFDLKIISIKDLIEYRVHKESLINREEIVEMPTEHGDLL